MKKMLIIGTSGLCEPGIVNHCEILLTMAKAQPCCAVRRISAGHAGTESADIGGCALP